MTLDVRSGSKLVRLFQTTSFVYHDALTSVNMVPDWPIWYCHINVLHVCPPPINGKTLKPVGHRNQVYHSWKLNYSPKRPMTSYRPCSLFLRFRSIWGFCKWFQMIPYTQKRGVKKSLSCLEVELLHEVLLDLLQPIQVVLDLQVNMRPMEMVSNDLP